MQIQNVRNFAIIAYIDHGNHVEDRIMEQTQTVSDRESQAQIDDGPRNKLTVSP